MMRRMFGRLRGRHGYAVVQCWAVPLHDSCRQCWLVEMEAEPWRWN